MLVADLDYTAYRLPVTTNKVSKEQLKEILQSIVGPQIWKWLLERWDDRIFTVKVLFIKKSVRVRDLNSVWVFLFGPQPILQPES